MRARTALLTLLAVALAVAGCDRGQTVRERCLQRGRGRPPGDGGALRGTRRSRAGGLRGPRGPVLDESRSLAELTAMYERASPLHRTLGLTQSRLSYAASLEAAGLSDGGRVCMRVRVAIEVSAAPVTVFIAREIAAEPCRRAAVYDHEMRHAQIHATFLEDARTRLLASLVAGNVGRVRFAADAGALQQEAAAEVSAIVAAAEADDRGHLSTLQSAIDTPEEYARVGTLCDTALVAVPAAGPRVSTDRR